MTTTAVKEFLNKVNEDEALQAELAKAMEAENDRQAVTDLAENKGYDFTPDELWAEVQKIQAQGKGKQAEDELSDEELEAVAGGELNQVRAQVRAVGQIVYDRADQFVDQASDAVIGATKW